MRCLSDAMPHWSPTCTFRTLPLEPSQLLPAPGQEAFSTGLNSQAAHFLSLSTPLPFCYLFVPSLNSSPCRSLHLTAVHQNPTPRLGPELSLFLVVTWPMP